MIASRPDPLKRGGVSGHVHNLSDWLSKKDCDVVLLSFSDSNSAGRVGRKTIRTIRMRAWYKFCPLVPILRISSIVSQEKPDVLHVQGSSLGYGLLYSLFMAPRRLPKVVTVHGHPVEEGIVFGWARRGSFRHRMMVWCERKIPSRFDAIVTVTEGLKSDLKRRYPSYSSADIRVIPNGVDPTLFTPQTAASDLPELGLRHAPHGLTIVCAKAITTFNGQEVLIRSFKHVVERVPASRLILAGDGPESPRLRQIADELGILRNVHFMGQVPNSLMPRLISLSNVVVLPSRRVDNIEEGSSLAVLEAMASGRPVITSRIGGSIDTIVDGKTGILVPENDPESLAKAILEVHAHPGRAEEMARQAREYVVKERTWDCIASRYLSVYESIRRSA